MTVNEKTFLGKSKTFYIKAVKEKVISAVDSRMLADVNIAAFLSGGIDSSIIVAAMSELNDNSINTFSLVHDQNVYDESIYSDLIAKIYRTNHYKIKVDKPEVISIINEAINKIDSPSIDGINSFLVSKKINQIGIRVALSGLGGDEVFAGYPQFRYWYYLNKINQKLPIQKLKNISKKIDSKVYFKNLYLNKIFKILGADMSSRAVNRSFRNMNLVYGQKILKNPSICFEPNDFEEITSKSHSLSQYTISELQGYTSNVLLKDTDQMSMANGLEVRVPFLDHNLIEFILNTSDDNKFSKLPKSLLIKAFEDSIPEKIYRRKKQGFTIPIQLWMKDELKTLCVDNLEFIYDSKNFNADALKSLWDEYQYNGLHWENIWSLVVLAKWSRNNGIVL